MFLVLALFPMRAVYVGIAVFLLLTLVGGLLRILWGPTRADRMLAAQLFGTTGVAVLLVLSQALDSAALRDVALVFAVLAAVNTVVFVRQIAGVRRDGSDRAI
jgi:multicomponent Na+:H+ antiporter subunit F